MAYKTYLCGCKIVSHSDPLGIGGTDYHIEYCPLHETASLLIRIEAALEALKLYTAAITAAEKEADNA